MPRIGGEPNGDGVQAVVLALRILEYLAEQGKAVGVTALAQALGTTKSRIYRHLRTLVQQGYIQQSADTDRYRVGTRLLTLGVSVAENFDLTKAAQGILRELRDALGLSCVVSQVDAAGVRVLATIPGKSAIEIGVKPGSLLRFHSSAQGKIALAFGSDQLRAAAIGPDLEMMTPQTIVNPEALQKEIQRVRARGWAIAPNEAVTGLNTLAVPIFDASGELVGTVGVVELDPVRLRAALGRADPPHRCRRPSHLARARLFRSPLTGRRPGLRRACRSATAIKASPKPSATAKQPIPSIRPERLPDAAGIVVRDGSSCKLATAVVAPGRRVAAPASPASVVKRRRRFPCPQALRPVALRPGLAGMAAERMGDGALIMAEAFK